MFFNMLSSRKNRFEHEHDVLYIECNFYTNRQTIHTIIKERNLLDTKLLIFLKLLLRYMYLRADECIRR